MSDFISSLNDMLDDELIAAMHEKFSTLPLIKLQLEAVGSYADERETHQMIDKLLVVVGTLEHEIRALHQEIYDRGLTRLLPAARSKSIRSKE